MRKINLSQLVLAALLLVVTIFASCKKTETPTPPKPPANTLPNTITDDGGGIGTQTWEAGKTYILDGFCFVNSGQTLTIEAGAIIKGKSGQGAEASALIVARGGKILAEGTASDPIIFTAEADDLKGSVPNDASGLWGGLIVLGNAKLNTIPAEQQIEGIPTTEPRGAYGGTNDNDNSGILKYISIRHGGTDIGDGNEINGLTLGGVGSKTEIGYIEVLSNADDGIECFGGMPNLKHILISGCKDDGLDYDQGFRGNVQFYCVLNTDGDRCGEHDGGTNPEDGEPYAIPTIFNATYIGTGNADARIIVFRDNAGGYYYNSLFVDCLKGGIEIEKLASGECSYSRFENGQLKVENNVFYNISGETTNSNPNAFIKSGKDGTATEDTELATYFTTAKNIVANPGVSVTNPVPSTPQTTDMASYPAGFENVAYKGAFGSTNWAQGWTATFN